jgi:anti-sigma B factor antagonist
MKIDTEHVGGILIMLVVSESLDAGNVEEFRKLALPLLSVDNRAVLDMSNLNFVDSAGLGSILACLKAVRQQQGELKLCALSRPVQALFEMMRMQKVFSVYGSRDEALRSF